MLAVPFLTTGSAGSHAEMTFLPGRGGKMRITGFNCQAYPSGNSDCDAVRASIVVIRRNAAVISGCYDQ